jgi:hypothetical protein
VDFIAHLDALSKRNDRRDRPFQSYIAYQGIEEQSDNPCDPYARDKRQGDLQGIAAHNGSGHY